MRQLSRLLFWLLVVVATVTPVRASFDGSKAWFETLSSEERSATQTDLILLGHYEFLVDGQFGRGTFEALADFQKSQGRAGTGILTELERRALRDLAGKVGSRLGLELVSDQPGHVAMMIPARLLSIRTPTGIGTSYASEDGEFSLETMHASLSDQSFADLYRSVVAPDDERTITYRNFGDERFVVTGMMGEYSFYTMFLSSGVEAVGYSLAWGKAYQSEGTVTSVWLASHFTPLGALPPDEETRKSTGAPPPSLRSAFELPADEPDVIALNAEIDGATPRDFDRAIAERPGARIVVLNSPGGAVDSALVVAQEIRRRGLKTYVPSKMGCYSACAYIFFAGSDRQADGELGVHQISTEVADLVLAQTTLGDVLDALDEFGVTQQVISHMLRTPPEDMYVFSRLELSELEINRGTPFSVRVAVDGPVADPGLVPSVGIAAFVQLSSQSSRDEAERSLAYAEDRWGTLFGDASPEVDAAEGGVYRIRLPLPSLDRANSICAAIKADGGGCYVTTAGG